jgi:hypothetical protein
MDNIYYGPMINENLYFREWLRVFNDKEDNTNLIYSILDLDNESTEDLSIGAQAAVYLIKKNNLWVNEEIISKLVEAISLNFECIKVWFDCSVDKDKHGYSDSWVDKRRSALLACINDIVSWHRIIRKDYNLSSELYNVIQKQIIKDDCNADTVLNNMFLTLKNIAVNKYKVYPNIEIPKDISLILTEIRNNLGVICTKDASIVDAVKKIDTILSKKKWLI